ncbi:malto-oligosyltrehalose synthase [Terracoccus luteus]|uniref:malto-oligosyltrehalose synthase n=2 Tax=Terracoccus luteus TaxID=53356 RepID=UPI0027E54838|nr:malto-oligosyltrehalose synthase [Terracoccus luteus]
MTVTEGAANGVSGSTDGSRPGEGMPGRHVPVSTHRFQLEPDFTLEDAEKRLGYLVQLGVTDVYLSPVLQASEGSTHGYDVTDHRHVAAGLGGDDAFRRLTAAARSAGLGVVVDVVPNHMTTPTPLTANRPLWALLREGRESPWALWFDVDWDAQDGRILMPVLGDDLESVLASGEIELSHLDGQTVVRYYDHVFPVAAGTERLPLPELLDRQHYRLASWTTADDELNYRRFFDVTSLIAVRVEEPAVFEATHAKLVGFAQAGELQGLRIDHPDGLADPQGYLERLADATGGIWVVVEKILEGDEQLPADWATDGTTGYDAMLRVGGLFVDPDGEAPLTALSTELLGQSQDLEQIVVESKRWVVEVMLSTEVSRLVRLVRRALPEVDAQAARHVVESLLVGLERYRVYLRPGSPAGEADAVELGHALTRGRGAWDRPLDDAVVERVMTLALGRDRGEDAQAADEFVVRFQQTCGPAMAKAIEDTAYYRFVRLTGLNEVGGDPGRVGIPTSEFHQFATGLAQRWPRTMTTLSTHDTKRSEDVRARLFVLSERPDEWARWVRKARELAADHRSDELDDLTEYFLWQTLVGAWPITAERLDGYALKAIRESKLRTRWTAPDEAYEKAVADLVAAMTGDPAIAVHVEAWHSATARESRAAVLGQKLVQLTMPGVPDVYQGNDIVDLSLVDPDNRRAVDYAERSERLARLDDGGRATDLHDEKLLVTSRALRVRRALSDAFVGEGTSHVALDAGSEHVVAFGRGQGDRVEVVTLATRLAGRLADSGGWGDAEVTLPQGDWRDVLSDRRVDGGRVPLATVLPDKGLPVALLVRVGSAADLEATDGAVAEEVDA